MNAMEREDCDRVSSAVVAAAFRVSNTFGAGFLEKVYENALGIELRAMGLQVEQQMRIHVRYRQEIVGEYVPDLLVERSVIVEVKAIDSLHSIHRAQCMNYLRATSLSVALLVNFGRPRIEIKRVVWDF